MSFRSCQQRSTTGTAVPWPNLGLTPALLISSPYHGCCGTNRWQTPLQFWPSEVCPWGVWANVTWSAAIRVFVWKASVQICPLAPTIVFLCSHSLTAPAKPENDRLTLTWIFEGLVKSCQIGTNDKTCLRTMLKMVLFIRISFSKLWVSGMQ